MGPSKRDSLRFHRPRPRLRLVHYVEIMLVSRRQTPGTALGNGHDKIHLTSLKVFSRENSLF